MTTSAQDPLRGAPSLPGTAVTADDAAHLTVAEISEEELLARFVPLLPRGPRTLVPTGDDAAVVAAPDGRFVVSTDVLVENHHFRQDWGDARDLGARAAAQNLADIAAMGAVPTTMVVALVLPPATPVSWVVDLARGIADVCTAAGVGVDGGDLSAGHQLAVGVTVHGDLQERSPVLRSGARPGDVLAHAGVLGHGAAGYALLMTAERGGEPVPADVDSKESEGNAVEAAAHGVVQEFLRPDPPLAAGPAAADAGATALIDVSDGLLRDAERVARASGVELLLDPLSASVPEELALLAPVARRVGADPATWVLTGGEDHGMLATFPAGTELPAGFRRLGTVREAADGQPRVWLEGAGEQDPTGWDHFRASW